MSNNNSYFNGINDGFNNLSRNTSSMMNNMGNNFNNIRDDFSNRFNDFSNSSQNGTNGFSESNGIIAKFAFFILVVICFLIGLNLGIIVLSYFLKPSSSVYVITGMMDGTNKMVITQNPKDNGSKLIRRSNNETTGIEFTWCVWLRLDGFISDPLSTDGYSSKYQPIFVKGDGAFNTKNISSISNGPGVYFAGSSNNPNSLRIMMDTVSKYAANEPNESTAIIDISNIPVKKWFHLVIRCQNKYLDVYINGLVVYRTNLINVPLQNYDNVRVCDSGGFNGKLSNLLYYNYALNAIDINGLVNTGPDLTDSLSGLNGNGGPSYLSTLWYKS